MIGLLSDIEDYRERRETAWKRNGAYWLSEPLRHVTDVGDYIFSRVVEVCSTVKDRRPVVVDMGCGSCWLLHKLLEQQISITYIGLDNNEEFIRFAEDRYGAHENVSFRLADLDMKVELPERVDLVVNAFNFFELSKLSAAMESAASWLLEGGRLLMSTIDKTYLILALSRDWNEFHENLRVYQLAKGVKYDFQKIDLGNGLSQDLEYPSVLYTTQDYIDTAKAAGLTLASYVEHAFTGRTMPKIYIHLEFIQQPQ